jgi:hypothetical protein
MKYYNGWQLAEIPAQMSNVLESPRSQLNW